MSDLLLKLSEAHPHVMQVLIPHRHLVLQVHISLFKFRILQPEVAIL